MKDVIIHDIVITTAQVFGRPAPRIVTQDMVRQCNPVALLSTWPLNLAVTLKVPKLTRLLINGVSIIGVATYLQKYQRRQPDVLIKPLQPGERVLERRRKTFDLNLEDDILQGCVITHGGEIVKDHQEFKKLRGDTEVVFIHLFWCCRFSRL